MPDSSPALLLGLVPLSEEEGKKRKKQSQAGAWRSRLN